MNAFMFDANGVYIGRTKRCAGGDYGGREYAPGLVPEQQPSPRPPSRQCLKTVGTITAKEWAYIKRLQAEWRRHHKPTTTQALRSIWDELEDPTY